MNKGTQIFIVSAMLTIASVPVASGTNDISVSKAGSNDQYVFSNASAMISDIIYDFKYLSDINPYIGIGGKSIHVKSSETISLDTKTGEDSDIVPAYQIITGLSYSPAGSPAVELNLGYSYSAEVGNVAAAENDLRNHQEYEVDGHSIAAGLKFNF